MQETSNYKLKKPEENEYYNVGDFNENADIVDRELKRLSDEKADLDPETKKIPTDQLPEMNFIPSGKMGKPDGVATLDKDGKIEKDQLPDALLSNDVVLYSQEKGLRTVGGEDVPIKAGGFVAQETAPDDTELLWIDTSVGGVTKYYNGSSWVPTASTWG